MMARLTLGFSLILLLPIASFGLGGQHPPISPPQSLVSNIQSPTGRLAYEEDFENPDSGWPVSDGQDIAYAYTESEYQVLVKQAFEWASVGVDAYLSDYVLEVDVRCASDRCSSYGIVFGLDNQWREFYALLINDHREFTVWKYHDDRLDTLLGWRYSRYLEGGDAQNRLRVVREGSGITVIVNGHTLIDLRDGAFMGLRKTGVFVYSGVERPAEVRFDNFRLYTLATGVNYAEHKLVEASTTAGGFPASLAVDGDTSTYWASGSDDEFQYLTIDVGADYTFDHVFVDWGEAPPKQWGLMVWNGSEWQAVTATAGRLSGVEVLEFEPHQGRRWVLLMWEWTQPGSSYAIRELGLLGSPGQSPNLALRKPVFVSSFADDHSGGNAVDGDLETHWASESNGAQWLLLNLEQSLSLNQITIHWGQAYGKTYGVLVGQDDTTAWVAETSDGQGGTETFDFERTTAKWLLIYGWEPGTDAGYSVREVVVRDIVTGDQANSRRSRNGRTDAPVDALRLMKAKNAFSFFKEKLQGPVTSMPAFDPSRLRQR